MTSDIEADNNFILEREGQSLPATEPMVVHCASFSGLAYRDGSGNWRKASDNSLLTDPVSVLV